MLAALVVSLVGLLLLAFVFELVAEASDARAYPAPGQLVDIGGYRLHLNCTGTGSPTVVIDAGLGDWSTNWSWVQPEVAKSTRVCTYDRAGNGWSEAGPQPRTARQFAKELHALLYAASIPGPYVIAGHSLGGYTARLFAHDYPTEVAGVVLLESTIPSDDAVPAETATQSSFSPEALIPALARVAFFRMVAAPGWLTPRLPPEAERAYTALSVRPQYYQTYLDEAQGMSAGAVQVRTVQTLGDMPLLVLSRGLGNSADDQLWRAKQSALLRLSTRSAQFIAQQSGHNVEIDQPAAAVEAIAQMVERVRTAARK
jgi:pimeloyl-ACP methyl ester carboxylesterase